MLTETRTPEIEQCRKFDEGQCDWWRVTFKWHSRMEATPPTPNPDTTVFVTTNLHLVRVPLKKNQVFSLQLLLPVRECKQTDRKSVV